jgi:membrane-associated phospholipid phosphatase
MGQMDRFGRAPDTLRLAAVALGTAAAVYAVAVGTGAGREWDASLVGMAVDGGERRTAIAVAHAVNPATVVLAVLAVAVLATRRGGRSSAVATVAIAGGGPVAAVALEWGLGALDPTGGEGARALGPAFFPSGHAAVVTAVALAALLATRGTGPRLRPAVAGIAAALLAAPQFLLAWHHPSDVLGGVLLAIAWAAAVTHVLLPGRRPPERVGSSVGQGLAVAAILSTIAAVLAEALPAPAPAALTALAVGLTAVWGAVRFAAAIDTRGTAPRRRVPSLGMRGGGRGSRLLAAGRGSQPLEGKGGEAFDRSELTMALEHDGPNRQQEDAHVKPERAVLDVVEVVADLVKGPEFAARIAAVDLCPSGHARL